MTRKIFRFRTCGRKSHVQPDSLAGFVPHQYTDDPPSPFEITPFLPRMEPDEAYDQVARTLGLPTKKGVDGWTEYIRGSGMYYAKYVPPEERKSFQQRSNPS